MKLFKKKEKEERVKEVLYYIEADEEKSNEFAFSLLDMLNFKQNIILVFYYENINHNALKEFRENVLCKIIEFQFDDSFFCVHIPEIQSNMQLWELTSKMISEHSVFAGLWYIPLQVSVEEFLYNMAECKKYGTVERRLSKFKLDFCPDMSYICLEFDKQFYESQNLKDTLNQWENTFGDFDFSTWDSRNSKRNFGGKIICNRVKTSKNPARRRGGHR